MDNLVLAYDKARKGKSRQYGVKLFERDLEKNLIELRDELISQTYRTSEYSVFTIHDPKEREIFRLPFRDRVVHHAIMNVLEPIWTSIFITHSYSCIKGKDKILISPIFHWTDADVWNFIRSKELPYCELYDNGFHRIGCMFCPMASVREKAKALKRYPKVAQKYKEAIQALIDIGCYGQKYNMTADEIFDCWIKNENFSTVLDKRRQKEIDFE